MDCVPKSARSYDRSPRRHLDARHTARVERDQPVTVAAAEDGGLLTQRLDDPLDQLIGVILIRILIGQVRVFATEKPDAQHDCCHPRKVVRPSLAAAAPHAHLRSVWSSPHPLAAAKVVGMRNTQEDAPSGPTPRWALQQATDELAEGEDAAAIAERAREIVSEAEELEDERHNEYDDPDRGGEG